MVAMVVYTHIIVASKFIVTEDTKTIEGMSFKVK